MTNIPEGATPIRQEETTQDQAADPKQKAFFSGPPSNKVAAATLATAVATLFWTIAARTFWKTVTADDLALFISTSAVILTALIGFAVPESVAFAQHITARDKAIRNQQDQEVKELKTQIEELKARADKLDKAA